MNEATIAQTILTVLILAIFLGLLIWGIKTRQFRDVEEPKYRMMKDDDDTSDQPEERSLKP